MIRTLLLRYLLPTLLAIGMIALVGVPYIDRMLAGWFRNDVQLRAKVVMASLEEPLGALLAQDDARRARAYLERVASDERLLGLVVCTADGRDFVRTTRVPSSVRCPRPSATEAALADPPAEREDKLEVSTFQIPVDGQPARAVLVVHDLSFIDRRQSTARNFVLAFAVVATAVLAALAALLFRLLLQR